jgi:CRP-like cAMP-binding protein
MSLRADRHTLVHCTFTGSSFGELALMYNAPRAATVQSKTACQVWMVDRNTYRHLMTDTSVRRLQEIESFLRTVQLFGRWWWHRHLQPFHTSLFLSKNYCIYFPCVWSADRLVLLAVCCVCVMGCSRLGSSSAQTKPRLLSCFCFCFPPLLATSPPFLFPTQSPLPSPFFFMPSAPLTDAERSKIAEALEEANFPDHYPIVKQGDEGDTFFILKKGDCLCTQQETPNSPPKEIKRYVAGEYFGERALIKNAPRAATITTVGPCAVYYMNRQAFTQLLGPLEDILKARADSYKLLQDEYKKRMEAAAARGETLPPEMSPRSAANAAAAVAANGGGAGAAAAAALQQNGKAPEPAPQDHLDRTMKLSDLTVIGTLGMCVVLCCVVCVRCVVLGAAEREGGGWMVWFCGGSRLALALCFWFCVLWMLHPHPLPLLSSGACLPPSSAAPFLL